MDKQIVFCEGDVPRTGPLGSEIEGMTDPCPLRSTCRRYHYKGNPAIRRAPYNFESEDCHRFVPLTEVGVGRTDEGNVGQGEGQVEGT